MFGKKISRVERKWEKGGYQKKIEEATNRHLKQRKVHKGTKKDLIFE